VKNTLPKKLVAATCTAVALLVPPPGLPWSGTYLFSRGMALFIRADVQ